MSGMVLIVALFVREVTSLRQEYATGKCQVYLESFPLGFTS